MGCPGAGSTDKQIAGAGGEEMGRPGAGSTDKQTAGAGGRRGGCKAV